MLNFTLKTRNLPRECSCSGSICYRSILNLYSGSFRRVYLTSLISNPSTLINVPIPIITHMIPNIFVSGSQGLVVMMLLGLIFFGVKALSLLMVSSGGRNWRSRRMLGRWGDESRESVGSIIHFFVSWLWESSSRRVIDSSITWPTSMLVSWSLRLCSTRRWGRWAAISRLAAIRFIRSMIVGIRIRGWNSTSREMVHVTDSDFMRWRRFDWWGIAGWAKWEWMLGRTIGFFATRFNSHSNVCTCTLLSARGRNRTPWQTPMTVSICINMTTPGTSRSWTFEDCLMKR